MNLNAIFLKPVTTNQEERAAFVKKVKEYHDFKSFEHFKSLCQEVKDFSNEFIQNQSIVDFDKTEAEKRFNENVLILYKDLGPSVGGTFIVHCVSLTGLHGFNRIVGANDQLFDLFQSNFFKSNNITG